MQPIITKNIDHIKRICKEHQVQSLFAFGSVVSEKFDQDSDVDLLVKFKSMEPADYADNYFEIADRLEEILDRPVDLVTEKSLKNPYFIDAINNSKILIYG